MTAPAFSPSSAERIVPADPTARLTLIVAERKTESEGVISLKLTDPAGRRLPDWTPGAHVDVHLNGMVRQYSLCSASPEQDGWRVGILKEIDGRGGSKAIHDQLQVQSSVTVSLPRNNFVLHPAKNYTFIAGGIGITPILSMVAEAERHGATWNLVYGGRTRNSMAFLEELAQFGERVRLVPEDTDGRVDFAEYFADVREETLVYACGPEPLLIAIENATEHWPEGSLHTERFVAKDIDETRNVEFEVEFVHSGVTLMIPADTSILQIAEENDLPVISSCAEGTCGTCETNVLAGIPDHRDSILTDSEKQSCTTMFICVSRSKGGCALKLEI